MYLSQAVPRPPSLGIEWDLFRHSQLVEEVQLEPAVVTCGFAALLVPAIPLQPGQVCRGKTGPFWRRIARARCPLPSELGVGCRNPAH